MTTQKLDALRDYNGAVKSAAEILCKGGIVAVPTETVYGLAASAYSDSAIKAVFEAKGRPQDNPLIVHISSLDMLTDVARDIPECAYSCAKTFWPGPFTMVLSKGENISESVSAGLDTVAVRFPANKTVCDIITASGLPLAAPSANTSGRPSPTAARHVIDDLDGKIDAVVCGEDSVVGVESTVVSLVGDKPRLLRPGAVTPEQLRKVLPDLVIDDAVLKQLKSDEKAASPGMKYKHYAPKAKVILVDGSPQDYVAYVNAHAAKGVVALCFDGEEEGLTVPYITYGARENHTQQAHRVFEALRLLDEQQAQVAYTACPSQEGVGLAVYNRLLRAAGFEVVTLA